MNKIYSLLISGFAAALLLAGCDNPDYPKGEPEDGNGTLQLSTLTIDVLNADKIVTNTARSVDTGNFSVEIKSSAGTTVYSSTIANMSPVVTLPVGDYTVEVSNGTLKDADWDSPYYFASKNFTITKDNITKVDKITCKLANIKVTIDYTDELKALIGTGSDINVNVEVAGKHKLDFAYGETRAGFFKHEEGVNTMKATFSGTVAGNYISEYAVLSDVAPGQHRAVTFGIKTGPESPEEKGKIGTTGLSLDGKVTKVDLTRIITAIEEPVDPDDFMKISSSIISAPAKGATKEVTVSSSAAWTAESNAEWCTVTPASGNKGDTSVSIAVEANDATETRSATVTFTMGKVVRRLVINQDAKGDETAPSITNAEGSTIDLDAMNTIVDGIIAKVNINAPKGIANLHVEISGAMSSDDLEEVGLASKFDLCNPGELNEPLSGLGFPTGNDVIGKTTITFDISGFMGMLKAIKGEHYFKITVVDSTGRTAEATLKFLAV